MTGLARQGPVRSVVVVVILPRFELLVEEVNVVRDPVAIEELVELLGICSRSGVSR